MCVTSGILQTFKNRRNTKCSHKQNDPPPLVKGVWVTNQNKNILSILNIPRHAGISTPKCTGLAIPDNARGIRLCLPWWGYAFNPLLERSTSFAGLGVTMRNRPPADFELQLNKEIAWYARRNLLTEASFCCEQCQTYNSRPVPRNREHLHCARCGKLIDWEPVDISAEFGGLV